MGHQVSVQELREQTREFFSGVIDTLVERNTVRGDSYLEMEPDDFAAMWRDKAGRIKTGMQQDLADPKVIFEIVDSMRDIAGYAGLFRVWLKYKLGVDVLPEREGSSGHADSH